VGRMCVRVKWAVSRMTASVVRKVEVGWGARCFRVDWAGAGGSCS
jgi:hypothetical protein